MELIDTHTHLYLSQFDHDRVAVAGRAGEAQVSHLLMPNIDSRTIQSMMSVAAEFSGCCLPMMGLHPTSVNASYRDELDILEGWLERGKFTAIGETGIDLYWDATFKKQQIASLERHLHWATTYDLPIVLHSRNSLTELFSVLSSWKGSGLTGVFHCFPGDVQQARQAIGMGFKLGIGGVVTYKNSLMAEVVGAVGLEHLLLETDAPYLPPVPYRGKRNESAYLINIAQQLAAIKGKTVEEVAKLTTSNARQLFKLETF